MARRKKKDHNYLVFRGTRSSTDLERLVAEQDERLAEYYVKQDRYVARALDLNDRAAFYIGPKGVGKSAILQMVRLLKRNDLACVVNITPEDIAFSALANAEFQSPMLREPQKHMWLFKSLWDLVLVIELLKREEPSESSLADRIRRFFDRSEQRRFREELIDLASSQPGDKKLVRKVIDLVDTFEVTVSDPSDSASINLKGSTKPDETSAQRTLVLIDYVVKNLRESLKRPYYILIDDLDYNWQDTAIQRAFVQALFESLRKLNHSDRLKFCVSLREVIYNSLQLQDRDKYREWIVDVAWSMEDVRAMIVKRVAFVLNCGERNVYGKVFPSNSFQRMYRFTNGFPREMIRLTALSLIKSIEREEKQVSQESMKEAMVAFSNEKLEDAASEWNYRYPRLDIIVKMLRISRREFQVKELEETCLALDEAIEKDGQLRSTLAWLRPLLEDPREVAVVLLRSRVLMSKQSRQALPKMRESVFLHELSIESWLALHPMFIPAVLDVIPD